MVLRRAIRLRGQKLYHQPWPGDAVLEKNAVSVSRLWMEEFGEDMRTTMGTSSFMPLFSFSRWI
jgi:hypothetical protein